MHSTRMPLGTLPAKLGIAAAWRGAYSAATVTTANANAFIYPFQESGGHNRVKNE